MDLPDIQAMGGLSEVLDIYRILRLKIHRITDSSWGTGVLGRSLDYKMAFAIHLFDSMLFQLQYTLPNFVVNTSFEYLGVKHCYP